MALIYVVKTFETDGSNKRVGFMVTADNGEAFAIDKEVEIADGKTAEQYVQEALAAAQSEIDAWSGDADNIGKVWNPDTNSFEA
jgi:hypothetical protein